MGDRTYVELSTLPEFVNDVSDIAEDEYCGYTDLRHESLGGTDDQVFAVLGFDEVNYGELPFLKTLREKEIPYIVEWGDGGNYSAGTTYFLFVNGEWKEGEFTDSDSGVLACTKIVEAMQGNTPDVACANVKALVEECVRDTTLPIAMSEQKKHLTAS